LYTDTERSLASALDDILAARSGPAGVIARTEQPETYDVALWKALASDIGIGGLLIPEELGGAGARAVRRLRRARSVPRQRRGGDRRGDRCPVLLRVGWQPRGHR
jgi:alkylation response protein AidB-like acyl-CoA dehydrogenase